MDSVSYAVIGEEPRTFGALGADHRGIKDPRSIKN